MCVCVCVFGNRYLQSLCVLHELIYIIIYQRIFYQSNSYFFFLLETKLFSQLMNMEKEKEPFFVFFFGLPFTKKKSV